MHWVLGPFSVTPCSLVFIPEHSVKMSHAAENVRIGLAVGRFCEESFVVLGRLLYVSSLMLIEGDLKIDAGVAWDVLCRLVVVA